MKPRVVLITGAGQGLGASLAAAFHGAGYRVAVTDLSAEAAQSVATRLDPAGETVLGHALDVRDPQQFRDALSRIVEHWGSVEVLVNNAVVTAVKPVLEIDADEFDRVLQVNLRGTFVGCQVLGRYFKERKHGRIVNIASLAGQNGGTATGAHYATSKGGVLTLTKVFARDLGPFGVTVNAIAPGPLDSDVVRDLVPEDKLTGIVAGIPVGRLGSLDYVAATAVHLASEEAFFANGATWDINGGLLMR
ncbi:SDR family NAD(P)-dependent oxidoreductase [Novosphingobium olei]|uniref:SDR family NAD(P)-dependent oxidoreductase n=1 Tax=Novosphingobium olei TaxID=2728851 RepID=UPI00308FC696|nr:SDR family oxidoreductase [Novosphingobium olei]